MHALTTVTNPNPITESNHNRIVKLAKPNPICKVSEIKQQFMQNRENSYINNKNATTPFLLVLPTFLI